MNREKVKYSEKDTRGHLYIDCSECNRGGNGNAKDKCASGFNHKKGRKGGCFLGELRWIRLPVLGGFTEGEKIWYRSHRKHLWRGRYEEFETHKNVLGEYPIEVAKRA